MKSASAVTPESRFSGRSTCSRDLIRRELERGAEIERIRSALIEGEKSGKPKRFDANALKRRLRRVNG